MIRVSGLPVDETEKLNQLVKTLEAKRPRNELRSSLMDHKRTFENWPLVGEMGDLRAVLGWPAKAVEVLARRAKLEGFTIPGRDVSEFGLDEIIEQTQYLRRVKMGDLSSLVHAVAFEVTTTGDPADREPDVIITHASALNGTGTWNNRRGRLTDFLSVQSWKDSKPEDWALYLDDVTWVFRNGALDKQEHKLGRVPVEPLIYKPRLDRPFGQSRITRSIIFLTRSACRVIVRSESTADLYSAPGLLALGLTADQIAEGSWRSGIGNVVGIPDADEGPADAPQLARVAIEKIEQASQEPHVAQLRAWAQLFAGEASIPLSELGIGIDSNPASEGSFRMGERPLVAEASDAADEWGGAHRRTMLNAYALREGIPVADVPVELRPLAAKWRDVNNETSAQRADAFTKQAGAVPWIAETDAALDMLGIEPELARRLREERRRARASSMLTELGRVADGNA